MGNESIWSSHICHASVWKNGKKKSLKSILERRSWFGILEVEWPIPPNSVIALVILAPIYPSNIFLVWAQYWDLTGIKNGAKHLWEYFSRGFITMSSVHPTRGDQFLSLFYDLEKRRVWALSSLLTETPACFRLTSSIGNAVLNHLVPWRELSTMFQRLFVPNLKFLVSIVKSTNY